MSTDAGFPPQLDAMSAAPHHHAVLLENDRVRVLESWCAPGDTVPLHTHCWSGVLQLVSPAHFVRRDANDAVLVDTRTLTSRPAPSPGAVVWAGPLPPHTLENVDDHELRVITVEIKD